MAETTARSGSLREDCVRQALAIIETSGVEGLSLRDVARRLGVSHQAPYKHFANRDELLAEVVARAFAEFATQLDARPQRSDPADDLAEIGKAYIGYAASHPLNYRLMFGTPLPDPDTHAGMLAQAQHAFGILRQAIDRLPPPAGHAVRPSPDLDALYVWSTMHGLVSVFQSSAMTTIPVAAATFSAMQQHTFARLRAALGVAIPEPAEGAELIP
jgi:AcrR family transcriptional regulator